MHYKGINVTLEIVVNEGSWNAESAPTVRSRPTFQADGDFAGGAKRRVGMVIAVTPISPDVLGAAKGSLFLHCVSIADTVESPFPCPRALRISMFGFLWRLDIL